MTWVATAIVGGAVLGAGASIYAGNQAGSATKKAAQQAADVQRYMFDVTRGDLAPYRNLANSAMGDLASLYGWASPSAPAPGGNFAAGGGNIKTKKAGGGGFFNDLTLGMVGSGPKWIYRQNQNGMIEFNGRNAGRGQLGGYINPQTGEVFLNNDPYNQRELIQNYLRTGEGELPKNATRFGQAVDAMRQSGWTYTDPATVTEAPGTSTGAPSMDRFFASPDYNFRMEQANKALMNNRAAFGSAQSGPAINAMLTRSGELASGEFNNYKNTLFAAAGLGQVATGQQVAANQNTAGNLANIYMQQGAQRASTYGSTAAGVNSALQGGIGNWMLYNYLGTGGGASAPAAAYQPVSVGPYLL